jgi:AcrR family transcriptional regulator
MECRKLKLNSGFTGASGALSEESMDDLKNTILDTAKKRFERYGFRKTTVDEICRDLTISKKTLYQLFESKEDIFVSLFVRETLAARRVIFERLGSVDDPIGKLRSLIKIAIEYFNRDDTFMIKALKDEEGLYSPFLSTKYHALVEEGILDIITGILKEGVEKGVFRNIDLRITSYMFFKISQAFTYARTISFPYDEENIERVAGEISDLILKGLIK